MTAVDIAVLVGAATLTGGLWWFFFGPRHVQVAELRAGAQEIDITVKGGYSPNVIRARAGVPLHLIFDRQETGDCSARVVFPDFGVAHALPAFERTTVEFTPVQAGQFGFACGMNMIHGTLIVDAPSGDHATPVATHAAETTAEQPAPPADGEPHAPSTVDPTGEDREAAARRAETADLARRVIVGALFSIPVVVEVMARDLFHASWVPDVMMNHWLQLAQIAPVMVYTGWPIHRTGWLTLAHRGADMNTLITIGTLAAFIYSTLVTAAPSLFPAGLRDVYFEAVGFILTLILVGRLLEARAKAGTGEAIRKLVGLQARTARVIRDGAEIEVSVMAWRLRTVLRPGEAGPRAPGGVPRERRLRLFLVGKRSDPTTLCRITLPPPTMLWRVNRTGLDQICPAVCDDGTGPVRSPAVFSRARASGYRLNPRGLVPRCAIRARRGRAA